METRAMLGAPWSAAEGGDGVADPDRLYTRSLREDLEEARDKLLKLKKMNELLEGENQDLRRRLLSQLVNCPDAAETRELARRYGPELAHAFSSLSDENKYLKVKLQSSQRAEVRAEIRAEQLANALRSDEEKRYAFGLARDAARGSISSKVAMLEAGCLGSSARGDVGDSPVFRGEDVPGPVAVLRDNKHLRLRADANEHCLCTEKLQELMDSLDDNLKSYERNVWQLQVNVLEDERTELQMKVANLSERLTEIQSKIMNDPFLSAKYAAAGTPGAVPNAQTQLREASARLALAESVNAELERRLAFERSISRSWQTNLRAMQRELREHLASLALASRKSGMSCDLFRGGILQAAEAAARRDLAGVPGCERESLRLLRQAADRIDADAKRLEVYSSRIAELEREVKDLRFSNTRLAESTTRVCARSVDPVESLSVFPPVCDVCPRVSSVDPGDALRSGLLFARQMLADRLVCKDMLHEIDNRRRELREREAALGFSHAALNCLRAVPADVYGMKRRKRKEESRESHPRESESESLDDDVEEAETVRMRVSESAWSQDRDRLLVRQVELLRRLAGGEAKLRFPRTGAIEEAELGEEREKRRKKKKRLEGYKEKSREDASYRLSPEVEALMQSTEASLRDEVADIKEKAEAETERKAEKERLMREVKKAREQASREMRKQMEEMRKQMEKEKRELVRRLEEEKLRHREALEAEEKREKERRRERQKAEEAFWREREERRKKAEEDEERRRREREEEDARLRAERERRFQEEEEREQRRQQRIREEDEERRMREERRRREEAEEEERRRKQRAEEEEEEERRRKKRAEEEEEERRRKKRAEEEEEEERRRKKRAEEEEEERRRKQRAEEEEEEERRRKKRAEEEEEERRRKKRAEEEEEEERRRKKRAEEEEEERRRKKIAEEEEEEERRRKKRAEEEEEERRRKKRAEEEEEDRQRRLREANESAQKEEDSLKNETASSPPHTDNISTTRQEEPGREATADASDGQPPRSLGRLAKRNASLATSIAPVKMAEVADLAENPEKSGTAASHIDEEDSRSVAASTSSGAGEGDLSDSETESVTNASYSPRTALKHKILDKYNSLANAFKYMDTRRVGSVTLHQFADFVDESGLDYPFSTVHSLYCQLSQPADTLTEGLMYRNMDGDATLVQLGRRLEDIYGNMGVPFEAEGIGPTGRVTREAFYRVCTKAGLTAENSHALWNSIDLLGSGHLQMERLLLLLEDNVELEEVKRVEEEIANMEGGFMSFFGQTGPVPSPQPKHKRHESCGRPLALTRKLSLGFTEAEAAIDNVLEADSHWDVLFPLTRLAMIKQMQKTVYQPGERIQEAQDNACPLYIVMTGSIQLLSPGLLMETVAEEKSAPQLLFSEEMLEDKPNPFAVKALTATKVFAYSREDFVRSVKHEQIKRTRDVATNMALIKIVPVLSKLTEVQARRLARTFGEETFEDGEAIFKEFDEPDNFYLVKKGEAAVVKYKKDPTTKEMEEVVFRIYQPGEYFGEISILRDQTRTATVKARGICTVLSLPKEDFNTQLRRFETAFIGRAGRVYTAQGHVDKDKKPKKEPKKEKETLPTSVEEPEEPTDGASIEETSADGQSREGLGQTIEDMLATEQTKLRDECMLLLEGVPVLKELSLERRKEIVKAMSLECFYPNTPIILQGEESQNFYVLKTGTVAAELYVGPGKPFRKIKEYNSTCYFGEMSIIKNEPRGCYITAKSPVQLYSLTGEKFKELLEDCYPAFQEYAQAQYEQETLKRQASSQLVSSEAVREEPTADYGEIMNLLVQVPVINMLDEDALQQLTRAFKVECYQEREVIIHEGTPAEHFFIIFSGDVSVQKIVDGAPVEIVVLHAGEYLGEIAFLNEQPRTASCVAKSDVKLLSLTRSDFQVHLGALQDAFLNQAESKYAGSKDEAIPDWLVEAGEQGALYDPSGSKKTEDEDEEPDGAFRGTVDIDKEKEMYNKKRGRKDSDTSRKKSDASADKTGEAKASDAHRKKSGETPPGDGEEEAGKPGDDEVAEAAADTNTVEKKKKKAKEKEKHGGESEETGGETKKKGKQSQAKRRMSLAGGAALLAAAAAAKAAEGEPSPNEKEQEEKEETKAGEMEEKQDKEETAEKEKKKEKKKKKKKDEDEDAEDKAAEEQRIDEFRDLVRGTLKNKYGSIAQAFQQIDGNNSEIVDFDEFAAFVKDLRVQSLKKKDIQVLFDDLCQPLKGTLTVANLYRNIDKKDQLSKAEINLRWVEIFGGSRKAFKAVANLGGGDECTEENFINVAAAAGVSEENAKSIWTELDKAQTGQMHTKVICSYMAGELTAEEAAAKEEELASLGTRLWNFFGGSASDDENASASSPTSQGDEQKIQEALKWEDMAIVQRDDHRTYPTCTKRLVDVLEKKEGFMNLQLLQLRYVASTMRRECLAKGVRVMEAGDEACMVFCAWGEFKILQAGLFGESEVGVVCPDECFGLSELINDSPLTASLVTEVDNSVLWVLERDTYNDLIRDMLEARRAVVPVIENFLKSVPIVKDMSETEIQNVARACKIETFSPHQTVFRAGMAGDMFCFIFKGEITMLKPMGAGQEPIELGRLQAGVYFGEMAVIKNQRRTASIIAATDLTLFCLDKGSFERVLGRVKGKMIERAESLYKRQDVATTDPKEGEEGNAAASSASAAGAAESFGPGDHFEKKRTRKSSLALLQYTKIREAGPAEGESEKKSSEEDEEREARWAMAQDPEIIHRPPPLSAAPKKSALRTTSSKSVGIKNSVFFDEETLLPSPPSSDEGE